MKKLSNWKGKHSSSVGFLFVLCLFPMTPSCSQTPKQIFPEHNPPIVWPGPPENPRIAYVGQLRSSADLKAPTSPFQAIGNFFFGKTKPGPLYGPRAVLCTRNGRYLWIADPGGRCLHLYDLEDRAYKKIDRFGSSLLLSPVGLCLGPDDSIYVCDSEEGSILRVSAATGEFIESLRLQEDIRRPVALCYCPAKKELFVVDVTSHDIKVLTTDGRLIRTIGRRGSRPGEFNFPCDITGDGAVLWVADTGNNRIQGLTYEGESVAVFGQAGDSLGDLALPKAVAVDSENHVYVVDGRFENIQIFDRTGKLLLFFGSEGTGPGEFWLPGGIFIDGKDRIWVCDAYNSRIQVFDYYKERGNGISP